MIGDYQRAEQLQKLLDERKGKKIKTNPVQNTNNNKGTSEKSKSPSKGFMGLFRSKNEQN